MIGQPIYGHDGFTNSQIDNQRFWQRCPSALLELARVRIPFLETHALDFLKGLSVINLTTTALSVYVLTCG